MARRALLIVLTPGTPATGTWCNTCMTSGGVTIPLLSLNAHGVTHVATGVGCTTCDGPGDLDI